MVSTTTSIHRKTRTTQSLLHTRFQTLKEFKPPSAWGLGRLATLVAPLQVGGLGQQPGDLTHLMKKYPKYHITFLVSSIPYEPLTCLTFSASAEPDGAYIGLESVWSFMFKRMLSQDPTALWHTNSFVKSEINKDLLNGRKHVQGCRTE